MISTIIKVTRKIRDKITRYKFSKTNKFDNTNKFGVQSLIISTNWGKYSGCNSNCEIINTIIGNYCNIAPEVIIGPRNHILKNFTTHDFPYLNGENLYGLGQGMFGGYFNKIGHDVWIGRGAIIVEGVEIGNGAVVAAGSVVTKSIPPYAIVGGNPARFIRWRFSEDQMNSLEVTKWYDLDVDEILKNKDELEKIVCFSAGIIKDSYSVKKNMIEVGVTNAK